MLVLTRKVGQTLTINDNIKITITEISGDKVKIGIDAPKEFRILREELIQIMENNKQATEHMNREALLQLANKIKNDK